ncbi:hypothetical protein EVAR_63599_1 [Eumeta japonica]|uniref:Uncharacterized protein n=1 Tax=Eumeta variegata TaxID=151549 RepID=A0A4C1ZKL3_EUMVA|nr:hypothetical protein EVAR_63599_1 [Eumeta japonica]
MFTSDLREAACEGGARLRPIKVYGLINSLTLKWEHVLTDSGIDPCSTNGASGARLPGRRFLLPVCFNIDQYTESLLVSRGICIRKIRRQTSVLTPCSRLTKLRAALVSHRRTLAVVHCLLSRMYNQRDLAPAAAAPADRAAVSIDHGPGLCCSRAAKATSSIYGLCMIHRLEARTANVIHLRLYVLLQAFVRGLAYVDVQK